MGARALIRRYPSLEGRLPVADLARLPTPVESAPDLGAALGADLWLKRDDRSGEVYGGNKVRKLELLLGRALADGRRVVATTGAYGSHHVLATCVYGRTLGLEVAAVLCPQPTTEHVLDNLRAAHGQGARLIPVPTCPAAGPRLVYESVRRRAMLIPPGGSSPLGALAYVGAAFELAEQIERGECPPPARIFAALGSSGTLAGLALGAVLAGLRAEVVGVRVTPRAAANELTVSALATRASLLLHRLAPEAPLVVLPPSSFRVLHDQYGEGYGHATAAGARLTELAADLAGLGLDPTYTAKAFAGLEADVTRRPLEAGPALFWSTLSGAPLEPLTRGVTLAGLAPELAALFDQR